MTNVFRIICFLSISFRMFAQEPYEQMRFNSYSVDDGLSQNIVEAILQDSEGFMWFGTQDGLNRFDGGNFRTYYFKIDDSTSLSNNYVKVLYEDPKGNIWVGTYGGGLNKFDRKETFVRYTAESQKTNGINDNVVYNIVQTDENTLWMGTKSGLNQMNIREESFSHYTAEKDKGDLVNNVVYALIKAEEANKLWVGTRNGLDLFDIKTKTTTHFPNVKSDGTSIDVRDLYLDDNGTLWIATKGDGVFYKERMDNTFHHIKLSTDDEDPVYARKIYPGDNSSVWVGTFGEGLFYVNSDKEVEFTFKQSNKISTLSEDRVVAMYKDEASNYWVGTHGGGLNYFNLEANKFKHYTARKDEPNTLSHSAINYIYEDKGGQIYVATDAGIDIITNDSDKSGNLKFKNIIGSASEKLDDRGWLLYEDSENTLWVGLWNYGLSKYDRKTGKLTSYTHDPDDKSSIGSNYIESIEEDENGNLWIGLIGGGLDYFDKQSGTFKHYVNDKDNPSSLSNNRVHAITYDSKGRLWVGTDFGLNLYDPSSDGFKHFQYNADDSLSLNYDIVRVLYMDSNGTMWIGTAGGGISKMVETEDGDIRFQHFTTSDGLPNNNIAAIVEDDDHKLWITTFQGMASFNPITEEFRSYSTNDGLQGQEFIRRSALKSSDGRIFMGGYNGLNVFNPSNIQDATYEPDVRLVGVDIFNNKKTKKRLDFHEDTILLKYNDYLISFEVAATDYTSVNDNRYAYRLVGFDNEWVDNKNRRHFSYTNLPAGDYKLQVRATNSDGVWSPNTMSVSLSVIPPFWQTLWFQVFVVLLGGLVIFGYIRWRIYNLRRSKQKLKTLVGERTKEIEQVNQRLLKNQSLVNEQKDQISLQHEEIMKQNKIIQKQNDELKLANIQLEQTVKSRTKELRETNRELFASNHELDTFFYRAAHDLKGPVSTILGLTYLALKDGPDKQMHEYLRKMDDTAKRMSEILFNLQKINKIKHTNAEISEFRLMDVIHQALKDNIPDNEQIEQFINCDYYGVEDDTLIKCDFILLKIIFSNLFSNALKFSKPGEKTKVNIQFRSNEQSKTYRIVFEDFGVGIPEEFRDKVFDMFFIANDRNPGTGLGLYSTKMAVKKLGGSIIVDPSFESSSAFLVQIPFPAVVEEVEETV